MTFSMSWLTSERLVSPDFPAMVEAAERRRKLLGALAERRGEGEQSQTAVAAAMNSSQSSIARLETSATDARCRRSTATPAFSGIACNTTSSRRQRPGPRLSCMGPRPNQISAKTA